MVFLQVFDEDKRLVYQFLVEIPGVESVRAGTLNTSLLHHKLFWCLCFRLLICFEKIVCVNVINAVRVWFISAGSFFPFFIELGCKILIFNEMNAVDYHKSNSFFVF